MSYEPGCLARSLAGHDKTHYFIILKEDGEYVLLVDGIHRTILTPKRKKKKHIQAASQPLITGCTMTDELIRGQLKKLRKDHNSSGKPDCCPRPC